MILLFDISWVLDTVGIMLVDIVQPGMSTSNQTLNSDELIDSTPVGVKDTIYWHLTEC